MEKYVNNTFNLGDKVRVVYNPCTTDVFPETYEKKKQILYAGTVNARKGYRDMIGAFAKLHQIFPIGKLCLQVTARWSRERILLKVGNSRTNRVLGLGRR